MLRLIKEAVRRKIISKVSTPLIHCKLFEDNKGTMEMANILKIAPRTKYLNIKYHFFRQYIQKKLIKRLAFLPRHSTWYHSKNIHGMVIHSTQNEEVLQYTAFLYVRDHYFWADFLPIRDTGGTYR